MTVVDLDDPLPLPPVEMRQLGDPMDPPAFDDRSGRRHLFLSWTRQRSAPDLR
jgi:hypothetical protein